MFIEKSYFPAYNAKDLSPANNPKNPSQAAAEKKNAPIYAGINSVPVMAGMNTAPAYSGMNDVSSNTAPTNSEMNAAPANISPAYTGKTSPMYAEKDVSPASAGKNMYSAYSNQNGAAVRAETYSSCPDSSGTMPSCAPLAVPYVPFQQNNPQKYNHADALSNGTLYPGLNLPFHLKVEAPNVVNGPLSELQALDFVVHELALYLDTHPDDGEAFAVYKQYAQLANDARMKYTAAYGPLMHHHPTDSKSYEWINDPWPWNNTAKGWGK